MYKHIPKAVLVAVLLLPYSASAACIQLLQPVNGTDCIQTSGGLGAIFDYFALLYPWAVGSAAGIAIAWALWGGVMVMMSGGDSGKESAGKEKIMQAVTGLLIIIFSGVILNFLNSDFYI